MSQNKFLFLDLDDTLFDELDYVRSGFIEVSKCISDTNLVEKDLVFNQIMYQFQKYGRTGIFNRTMSYFELEKPSMSDLVATYREHSPNICTYDGVYKSLISLKNIFDKMVIITDGIVGVQRNKITALGLEKYVDDIIYCMEYNSPKPSTIPLESFTKNEVFDKKNSVMVGDDPYCDIKCANQFGITVYRVLTGRFKNIKCLESSPAAEFGSFCKFAKFLTNGRE